MKMTVLLGLTIGMSIGAIGTACVYAVAQRKTAEIERMLIDACDEIEWTDDEIAEAAKAAVRGAHGRARADELAARRDKFGGVEPPRLLKSWKFSEDRRDACRIDMNRIVQIESSGDPGRTGTSGERGLCQIMPRTWDQVTREMGVTWSFDEAFDPAKNLAVGTHYMTVTIPRYLASLGIPDTASARVVCYNWGFGNLRRTWADHGNYWLSHIPAFRRNHWAKYRDAKPHVDYVTLYASGGRGE